MGLSILSCQHRPGTGVVKAEPLTSAVVFGLLGAFLSWPRVRCRGAEPLLDQDLAAAAEKQKLRNQFWVILMFLTVGKSPLKQWNSTLKLESPELFRSLGKYFQLQLSQESFSISLQVKELQGYLQLKIPLWFHLLIFAFCKLPTFHGVGLPEL